MNAKDRHGEGSIARGASGMEKWAELVEQVCCIFSIQISHSGAQEVYFSMHRTPSGWLVHFH
jgi:hypothetical protein